MKQKVTKETKTKKTTSLPSLTSVQEPVFRQSDLVYSVLANPAHGTVAISGDGTYLYTLAEGYVGEDGFMFTFWCHSALQNRPLISRAL